MIEIEIGPRLLQAVEIIMSFLLGMTGIRVLGVILLEEGLELPRLWKKKRKEKPKPDPAVI